MDCHLQMEMKVVLFKTNIDMTDEELYQSTIDYIRTYRRVGAIEIRCLYRVGIPAMSILQNSKSLDDFLLKIEVEWDKVLDLK